MPKITLPDNSTRTYQKPITINQLASDIGPGLAKSAVAGRVNGNKVDATEIIKEDSSIEILTNDEGCYILFEDNGPGIPNKNYEDVFKPFFTLDPSRNKLKGESGLGLAITRDIIRSHGGEIRLDKSKLGGLKTIFHLPI